MKKVIITALFALTTLWVASAEEDKAIPFDQLPQAAQQLVTDHFPNAHIARVTKESERFAVEYDLYFTNGNKIEFDKKGEWQKIKCKSGSVPMSIVPSPIWKFVEENHKGSLILQLERSNGGYDVELKDGTEICFNVFGEFFKYDD